MVRELKNVGQMQQLASKAYNCLRRSCQTILSIGGLRKWKRRKKTIQPSNIYINQLIV
jgi:hypothetical protein